MRVAGRTECKNGSVQARSGPAEPPVPRTSRPWWPAAGKWWGATMVLPDATPYVEAEQVHARLGSHGRARIGENV